MIVKGFSTLALEPWPFPIHELPAHTYLVGGSVRDALMGRRRDYLDLDFVLAEGAVETAATIADAHHAGFTVLDAERQIARVVFDHATADFALQEGETLAIDLFRRDFTINAIAYDPHNGQLIDPVHGCADLQRGIVRMIARNNLRDDPLRLLRAYRQAAQLEFTLEPSTQEAIRELAPHLTTVAAERVQAELFYLLRSPLGTPWLHQAWQDGLFRDWLPSARAKSFDQITQIDQWVLTLQDPLPQFIGELHRPLRATQKPHIDGRTFLNTVKLTPLVSPMPAIAALELSHLKISRHQLQTVLTLLHLAPLLHSQAQLNVRDHYFLFQKAGNTLPALIILALATGCTLPTIQPLIDQYLDPHNPIAHPTPPLTGQDLIQTLNLSPGPLIGQLLTEIQIAKAEGHISIREDALDWAKKWLEQNAF
jgi:tRNA nucleotidyltransferase (CCA-adding enzyme)